MDSVDADWEEEPDDIKTPVGNYENIERAVAAMDTEGAPTNTATGPSSEVGLQNISVGLDTEQSAMELVSSHPLLQQTPRRLVRTPSMLLEVSVKRM